MVLMEAIAAKRRRSRKNCEQSNPDNVKFDEMHRYYMCRLTVTVAGGTGLVLVVGQQGGTEDVSRLLFCSKSFFTVGSVQHGFSFGAGKVSNIEIAQFFNILASLLSPNHDIPTTLLHSWCEVPSLSTVPVTSCIHHNDPKGLVCLAMPTCVQMQVKFECLCFCRCT